MEFPTCRDSEPEKSTGASSGVYLKLIILIVLFYTSAVLCSCFVVSSAEGPSTWNTDPLHKRVKCSFKRDNFFKPFIRHWQGFCGIRKHKRKNDHRLHGIHDWKTAWRGKLIISLQCNCFFHSSADLKESNFVRNISTDWLTLISRQLRVDILGAFHFSFLSTGSLVIKFVLYSFICFSYNKSPFKWVVYIMNP